MTRLVTAVAGLVTAIVSFTSVSCGRIGFDALGAGPDTGGGSGTLVGLLDPGFNGSGVVTYNYVHQDGTSKDDQATGVGIDRAGRIVVSVSGNDNFYVLGDQLDMATITIRLTAGGAFDPSYEYGALAMPGVTVDRVSGWSHGNDLVIDGADNPVVCGFREWGGTDDPTIYRYQATSGQPDPTFGTAGVVDISLAGEVEANGCVGDPVDGSYVIVGGSTSNQAMFVSKIRASDGSLVPGFGTNGSVIYDVAGNEAGLDAAVDAAGRIYVVGFTTSGVGTHDLVVWRYLDTGVLDGTFGTGGLYRFDGGDEDVATAVALDHDGKLVVVGTTTGATRDLVVLRLDTTGQLDPSFGTGGIVTYESGDVDEGNELAIDGAGALLVTGASAHRMAVWKLTSSGARDASFGTDGVFTTTVAGLGDAGADIAVAPDGLVVVGQTMTSTGFTDAAIWKIR